MKFLQEFRKVFDPILQHYFSEIISELKTIHPSGTKLGSIIQKYTLEGGKKIRPALFYSAYSSYSNKNLNHILKTAITFELIQSFALIHDDIIDHSSLRRGKPTLNAQFDYESALLFGDLALILADKLFTESIYTFSLPDLQRIQIQQTYNTLKEEVLIGQYMDYTHNADNKTIILLKTARYSFMRPVQLGLLYSGAEKQDIEKWMKVSERIGSLFQKKDDYIGLFGTEEEIGKPVTSDIEEGKKTFLIELFMLLSTTDAKKRFKSFFGKKNIPQSEFTWFKDYLREYGVYKKAQDIINQDARTIKEELKLFDDKVSLTHLLYEITDLLSFFSGV